MFTTYSTPLTPTSYTPCLSMIRVGAKSISTEKFSATAYSPPTNRAAMPPVPFISSVSNLM